MKQREPYAIVLAERGTVRHAVTYSWLATEWQKFWIGMRSWIDRTPSPVYTIRLHPQLGDTEHWLAAVKRDPKELRDTLVKTRALVRGPNKR